MKSVKFITLGLCALFALAACGDDTNTTSSTAGTAGGGMGGEGGGAGGAGGGAGGAGGGAGGAGGSGGGSAAVEVQTHQSPDGFAVDSHLVVGATEAVLVDGQFFSAEAQKVVELVKTSGKKLTTVFLTHAHPDHYIGMEIIRQAYPDAQFVTTAKVLADYNTKKDATLANLQMAFPGAVPDKVVDFTALNGTSILVDGYSLDVVEFQMAGESEVAAGLALKSMKAFIAGDLLYNQQHLWLAECNSPGWLTNLDTIAAMGFETIYPGHGPKGDAKIIDEDKKYIQDAQPILDAAKTSDEAIANLKAAYPTWGGEGLLNVGTQSYFGACKK
jgi:glyoxylase-like metal-dependent hydrolase (beta-lactamase superfamily II)